MIVRSLITRLGFKVDSRDANRYIRLIRSMTRVTGRLARSISRTTTSVIRPFVKSLGFANLGIVALGVGILKLGGQAEQSRIAFNTLTGSVEEGTKLYKDLITFAEKTPFRVSGLLVSTKKLLAFGFRANEVIDTMTTLGNIASGAGVEVLPRLIKALGDVKTSGRLYTKEVRQFSDAGIALNQALSQLLNVDMKRLPKVIEKGRVSYEDVIKALRLLERTRFSGLLEKQNRTLLGQFERLVDVIQNISREIGEALGPGVKELIVVVRKYISLNRELIKQNTLKFFKQFIILIGGIALAFFEILNKFGGVGGIMTAIVKKMKDLNTSLSKAESSKFLIGLRDLLILLGVLPDTIRKTEEESNSFFKSLGKSFENLAISIEKNFNKHIQPVLDVVKMFMSDIKIKAFQDIFSFKGASAEGIGKTRESLKKFETESFYQDLINTGKSALTSLGFKGFEDPRMGNNVNVQPTINITTAAGTTQQQSDSIKKQFEDYATPKLESVFKKAINDLRPVEAQ